MGKPMRVQARRNAQLTSIRYRVTETILPDPESFESACSILAEPIQFVLVQSVQEG